MKDITLKILNSTKVLLAEDDVFLADSLQSAPEQYCANICLCLDGLSALENFKKNDFDMVVTDINLPKLNGLTLAQEIRNLNPQIPIIIITAHDSDKNVREAIKINTLAFLKKPFSLEQLYSALLMASAKKIKQNEIFELGHGIKFDQKNSEIYAKNKTIHLTKTEANILNLLISNIGYMVSLEQIEKVVWYDKAVTPETIRTHINNIRSKTHHDLIQNVQGYGYKLNLE